MHCYVQRVATCLLNCAINAARDNLLTRYTSCKTGPRGAVDEAELLNKRKRTRGMIPRPNMSATIVFVFFGQVETWDQSAWRKYVPLNRHID